MKVTYIGPHSAVTVPFPHGGEVIVEHGKTLDTTNEHASLLLEQESNWKRAAQPAKKGG